MDFVVGLIVGASVCFVLGLGIALPAILREGFREGWIAGIDYESQRKLPDPPKEER